jgi:hypothetical protein
MRESLSSTGALGRVPLQKFLQQIQGGCGGFRVETILWICVREFVFVRNRERPKRRFKERT